MIFAKILVHAVFKTSSSRSEYVIMPVLMAVTETRRAFLDNGFDVRAILFIKKDGVTRTEHKQLVQLLSYLQSEIYENNITYKCTV